MINGDSVRIALNPGLCSGHARCHAVDPALFPIDDDGYSELAERIVEGELVKAAREGAHICPERAILIDGQ